MSVGANLRRRLLALRFRGSARYWERRYASGGDSGDGSYGELAEFKARVLSSFVRDRNIRSVIEFGCGDGHQLGLVRFPSYVGTDVSPTAIARCRERFSSDSTKRFKLVSELNGDTAELALSLDVIFHLVEDDIFEAHMRALFATATRFVVIYSSNSESDGMQDPHVRNRRFAAWIEKHMRDWRLIDVVKNEFPVGERANGGSLSDFYFYEKAA